MAASETALAFDVYGTLADLGDLAEAARPYSHDPERLAAAWRRHQLEISWLLSLMGRYEDFDAVTAHALDAAVAETGDAVPAEARNELLAHFDRVDLYDDVPSALAALVADGFVLAVLSNGAPRALESLLAHARIRPLFTEVVSADEVGVYKPAPAVYGHGAERLGRAIGDVWLVSANPFDCAGAKAAGMRVAKVERAPSFDYRFADPPDLVVSALAELAPAIAAATR